MSRSVTSTTEISPEKAASLIVQGFDKWRGVANALNLPLVDSGASGDQHLEMVEKQFARQELMADGLRTLMIKTLLTPQVFAGCGSTGYAATGTIRNFPGMPICFDPDSYDVHNVPRQVNVFGEVGRNKAHATADRITGLIPTLPVIYDEEGIQAETIGSQIDAISIYCNEMNDLLTGANIAPIRPIFYDSVDVTTSKGWAAKIALHEAAKKSKNPVLGAYDIGRRSQIFYFPYQRPNEPLLHGKIDPKRAAQQSPQELNMALMPKLIGPIPNVPLGYAEQYIRRAKTIFTANSSNELPGMPQERIAGALYEAAASQMTALLINDFNPDLPKLHSVEAFPDGISSKFKLVLLFAVNAALIKKSGQRELDLSK